MDNISITSTEETYTNTAVSSTLDNTEMTSKWNSMEKLVTDSASSNVSTTSNVSSDTVTPLSMHLNSTANMTEFQKNLDNVLTGLFLFLSTKNKNYGNSALSPVRVFSKAEPEDGILQRMDDKLSRIKNSSSLRKNDIVDLMGYLAILCINKGWTDFTELID